MLSKRERDNVRRLPFYEVPAEVVGRLLDHADEMDALVRELAGACRKHAEDGCVLCADALDRVPEELRS